MVWCWKFHKLFHAHNQYFGSEAMRFSNVERWYTYMISVLSDRGILSNSFRFLESIGDSSVNTKVPSGSECNRGWTFILTEIFSFKYLPECIISFSIAALLLIRIAMTVFWREEGVCAKQINLHLKFKVSFFLIHTSFFSITHKRGCCKQRYTKHKTPFLLRVNTFLI